MSQNIKPFIWATAKGSPERIAWLQANYNKPVTQEEYTQAVKALPHNHRRANKCRTPSRCRSDYEYLKITFGFFTENAQAQ